MSAPFATGAALARRRTAEPAGQVRAAGDGAGSSAAEEGGKSNLLTIGLGGLWAAFVGYGFLLSPNQTPYRDFVFVKLLTGLGSDSEGFQVNPVFTALFFIMGIWPVIYSGLLIPAARSEGKLKAWPFVAASFAVGIFALLPYMALWKPPREAPQLPPPREEVTGWRRVLLRGTEGRILPALTFASTLGLVLFAAFSGSAAWADYFKLFDESRFVNVTTVDFLLLCTFAPFWMYNDASARQWESKDKLLPVLSAVPLLGPALYLVLRPKTDDLL